MSKGKPSVIDKLRETAERFGFTLTPRPAVKPPAPKPKPKPGEVARLVEITRHIAGPPRRAPGQRLWLTANQIKAQGLGKEDFSYVAPPARPAKSPAQPVS